jgi:hypothetical protein
MNGAGVKDARSADAARSIAMLDSDSHRRLAQRTRRAVRDQVITDQETRVRQRHNLGWALMGFGFLLLLLAPAMWNGLEDLLAGEHILDFPGSIACLVLMFYTATFGVFIAVWKGQRDLEHDRGGIETFHPTQK